MVLRNIIIFTIKSLILKYPNYLKPEFHSHFIRGYFDGDGSITINRNKNTNNITFIIIKYKNP